MGAYHLFLNSLLTKLDNIHSYNTRQKTSQEYIVPRKKLAIAQKSLAYIGVKIWESLDQNLKVQHFFFHVFKKKCQIHLTNINPCQLYATFSIPHYYNKTF